MNLSLPPPFHLKSCLSADILFGLLPTGQSWPARTQGSTVAPPPPLPKEPQFYAPPPSEPPSAIPVLGVTHPTAPPSSSQGTGGPFGGGGPPIGGLTPLPPVLPPPQHSLNQQPPHGPQAHPVLQQQPPPQQQQQPQQQSQVVPLPHNHANNHQTTTPVVPPPPPQVSYKQKSKLHCSDRGSRNGDNERKHRDVGKWRRNKKNGLRSIVKLKKQHPVQGCGQHVNQPCINIVTSTIALRTKATTMFDVSYHCYKDLELRHAPDENIFYD